MSERLCSCGHLWANHGNVGCAHADCSCRRGVGRPEDWQPTPPPSGEQAADLAWAIARLEALRDSLLTDVALRGPGVLRGKGYPDMLMADAQDGLALRIVLAARPAAPGSTAVQFLHHLSTEYGCIVSTGELSIAEIASARACGRMFVTADGLGFVHLQQRRVDQQPKP